MNFERKFFTTILIILLPGDNLDKSFTLWNACVGIEHARISSVIEIRRHTVIFRVSQHVLQLSFGCFFHRIFHFFVCCRFINSEAIIKNGFQAQAYRLISRTFSIKYRSFKSYQMYVSVKEIVHCCFKRMHFYISVIETLRICHCQILWVSCSINLWRACIRQCYLNVISHNETLGIGTLNAMAEILPLSSGIITSNDLLAPVAAGMIFWRAPLPSLHNDEVRRHCSKNNRAKL